MSPQAMSDEALQGAILRELIERPDGPFLSIYQEEAKRRFGKRRGKEAVK